MNEPRVWTAADVDARRRDDAVLRFALVLRVYPFRLIPKATVT